MNGASAATATARYNHPPPLPDGGRRLQDKVILVTGASSGIGAAAAIRFAREGARVLALARRAELLHAVVDSIVEGGGEAVAVVGDISDEDAVRRMVDTAVVRFGRLDGAFNNAGAEGVGRLLHEVDVSSFDAIVATNLRGTFLCLKYEIKQMLANGGGSIVNTSSIGGLVGGPAYSDYAATKFGIAGLTKCAAVEYAGQAIRVNAVAPGPTSTPILERWASTEEERALLAEMYPMNFIADPDDIARAALFLLSDEARWTTGVVLPCDGGFTAQ
jgi:NAD(P)-dependent dehydrogenase (short-subunit alcohol dehydrogenase family)